MRILHVYTSLNPGGIENWLARIPRYMPRDIELHYFLREQEGSLAKTAQRHGVTVILPRFRRLPLRLPLAGFIPSTCGLVDYLRRVNPHVIHVHTEDPGPIAVAARAIARSPAKIIQHFHNRPYARKGSRVYYAMRLTKQYIDLFLCCSDFVRQAHSDFYGLPASRVKVVYYGIPLEKFSHLPKPQEAKDSISLPDTTPVVLFVGRLVSAHKGLDVLLEATSILRQRSVEFLLAIVGDGPDRPELEAQARALGIEERCKFLGYWEWPDLLTPLCAADIYVQPSRWEGLPISILEAMAARLPVVATNVCGIPEAVSDGISGLIVPPEDPHGLADAIQWMIEHPDERRRMGEAGRRIVEERFDMRVTTAQLVQIYRSLAEDQ